MNLPTCSAHHLSVTLLLVLPACPLSTFGPDGSTEPSGMQPVPGTGDPAPTTGESPAPGSSSATTADPGSTSGTDTGALVDASTGTTASTSSAANTGDAASTSTATSTGDDTSTGAGETQQGSVSSGEPDPCGDVCDGATPVCDPDMGLCVGCLQNDDCPDAAPICDAEQTCQPCDDHAQCAATACDLESGACMPETCIFYVNTGLVACNQFADGLTPQTPLCSLSQAIALLQPDEPCTIKLGYGSDYQPSVIPEGNYTVAIVPYDNQKPLLEVSYVPVLTVQAGNKVYMRDLALVAHGYELTPALKCRHADLWLDRQHIGAGVSNTRHGVYVDNCRLHMRQSIVTGFTRGGIDVVGEDVATARLWLENSYLTEMSSNGFGALRLQGAVEASLLYTTVAEVYSQTPIVDCLAGFSGTLHVRNSAIVGAAPRFGAACEPEIEDSYDSADKFGLFSSQQKGQYKASIGGPLKDVGEWLAATDPKVDQDGTPRPTVNHAMDYAGADRP